MYQIAPIIAGTMSGIICNILEKKPPTSNPSCYYSSNVVG